MSRVNIDILGISELKWTGMGEFNSDDYYIHYSEQVSFRRNGVALIVLKKVQNAVLGWNLQNNRVISVCFQGKPFSITANQIHVTTTNAKEAEDLQDLPELTPKKKKRYPFHHTGLECKSRKSRDNRQVWAWSTKWSRTKANRILPRECTGHSKHLLPTTQDTTLHMDITRWS